MAKQKEFKLTAEGSLGVLALGDIGLKLWREERKKLGKDPYEKGSETKNKKSQSDGEEASK